MRSFLVQPASSLRGEISLSGDKSIAHRCIILGAISQGRTTIENFPTNRDSFYTLSAFQELGIKIIDKPRGQGKASVTIFGKGLFGLRKPKSPIFVGDSGTTLRLILGVLAGQSFKTRLVAGKSLSLRPMHRVTKPLRMMGAEINSKCLPVARLPDGQGQTGKIKNAKLEEYSPLSIRGGNLKSITYRMPVASAQVKSAILLAGLYVKGKTQIIEPIKTRDHTERILNLFRANIKLQHNKIVIKGIKELTSPKKIYIPGDISSASFFIVLAILLLDSQLLIKNVSLNPSRMGITKVLKRMGAKIKIQTTKVRMKKYEPMGDILVKNSLLKGTVVKKEEVPLLIDELPVLMVAASQARGITVFEGVEELRVKETDRIKSMFKNLKKMGAKVKVVQSDKSEKIVIQGVKGLRGSRVRSFGDHRTAMSMVVAGLAAKGNTRIDDVSCIDKSFPDFLSILKKLI